MAGPLIIDVTRGEHIESRHRVDVVAVDADGSIVWWRGDGRRPTLPRSAIKPVQALPVARVEDDPVRLALAASSHNGEPEHVAPLRAWLAALGLDESALLCGPHPPMHRASADRLAAAGDTPGPIHSDCSGKHVGFLAVCLAHGLDIAGYLAPDHPLQRDHVSPAITAQCGVDLGDQTPGVDGCGIPVWTMPLDRLAAGWASLPGHPDGAKVIAAMAAHPHLVAGTDRPGTRMIETGGGRVVAKSGAEGVYCGIDRDSGVAIAVKAQDGAGRAAAIAGEWALAELGALPAPAPTPVTNWAGTHVGEIRVVA
ncbi:MAG: asparaginase [Acidimicrobiales bacterium]|nr:asparaginase [Acidimicrobiales bacterium]